MIAWIVPFFAEKRQGRGCFSSAPLALFQRICHPVQGGGVVLIQQVGVDTLPVVAGVEWPRALPMSNRGAPWAEATVAKVWRRPWRVIVGQVVAAWMKRVKARDTALGE